jgi:hypothetical protein
MTNQTTTQSSLPRYLLLLRFLLTCTCTKVYTKLRRMAPLLVAHVLYGEPYKQIAQKCKVVKGTIT